MQITIKAHVSSIELSKRLMENLDEVSLQFPFLKLTKYSLMLLLFQPFFLNNSQSAFLFNPFLFFFISTVCIQSAIEKCRLLFLRIHISTLSIPTVQFSKGVNEREGIEKIITIFIPLLWI